METWRPGPGNIYTYRRPNCSPDTRCELLAGASATLNRSLYDLAAHVPHRPPPLVPCRADRHQ